ncbi:MAG: heavy metal transporter [Flavobacterium sp.]|jgi:copper chaperone CopZ|uniref:heavy-metal-associated domain-containing protein n=1 Tax=Flavobacterium sp. TaxID=239 RepID=UPI000CC144FE|nr:heavy metal-associated domain-containing protein [Flavobacterium sp.]MBA4134684.1 heavy metal transporter [Flavobacterium sp.]PJE41670.1 MAG: heavy metal transporter [Flavobacterium sp.] [Flavobacterium sp. FEMGT703F]
MEQQFEVENIKCGGCMNSIKTALLKLDGVTDVSIDKEIDTVTVTGTMIREDVINKLNDLGYPEKGNNTLIRKAKSYVNCAIGRMSETES